MQIFEQELKDGLGEALRNSKALAYTTVAKPSEDAKEIYAAGAAIDVFHVEGVLASVGINDNDDIFTPYELFKARATPIHKKFNLEHDEKTIIGTINNSYLRGPEGAIASDVGYEELPDNFDVVTQAVLWTRWEDEDFQKVIDSVVTEMVSDDNEWALSMECMFPHFDYGVLTSKGELKLIERTEKTSFLTKHLRYYGGKGSYGEYEKLYRILRDITFSGKAATKNPANKKSIILSAHASKKDFTDSITVENKIMTVDFEAKYNEAQLQLETAKASLKNFETEAKTRVETEKVELNKAIASKEEVITTLKNEVETLKALSSEKDGKIAEINTAKASIEAELVTAKASLDQFKLNEVKSTRIGLLLEVGVEKAKASTLVDKFASASDEMFAELVELHKTQAAVAPVVTTETNPEVDEKGEQVAKAGLLETLEAKVDGVAATANAAVVEDAGEVMKSVASAMGILMGKPAKKETK